MATLNQLLGYHIISATEIIGLHDVGIITREEAREAVGLTDDRIGKASE